MSLAKAKVTSRPMNGAMLALYADAPRLAARQAAVVRWYGELMANATRHLERALDRAAAALAPAPDGEAEPVADEADDETDED